MKFYRTWPLDSPPAERGAGRWGLCRLEQACEAGDHVSERERARAATFRSPARRLEWLGARAGLRRMLQEVGLVGSPIHCRLDKDRLGRPRIECNPGDRLMQLDVSLTHKKGLAGFCANWSGTTRVGMDLEILGRKPWRLRRAFATKNDSLLELQQQDVYYSILWACKEAASKVLGKGLLMDFKQLVVSELEPGKVAIVSGRRESMEGRYYLKGDFVAALVTMPGGRSGNAPAMARDFEERKTAGG